jgi:hypothetical protein
VPDPVIELRIYRAAFIPAAIAAIVAMFSLESRPPAVPQGLAADVLFDGRVALTTARRLVAEHPDRRAGKPGGLSSAQWVGDQLTQQGFDTTLQRFTADGRALANVVARRPGASPREIVVVVPRDARSVPDAGGSAVDTASLVELARALEGRATRKTLVLASIDGSDVGGAGARALADELAAPGTVETVLVLSSLGAAKSRGPLLVPWSASERRTGLRLQRTAGDSVRQELESGAGRGPGGLGQFTRLAFPVALGDQAPFLEAGYDSIRITGSGELPAEPGAVPDPDRLGSLGRAALRVVSAYDVAGPVEESPTAFLVVTRSVLPGWAIALLAGTLIIPALVALIDAFARVRRRREPVLPWLRWALAGAIPLLLALAAAELLVLVGQAPDSPAAPLPPDDFPFDGAAAVSVGLCALVAIAAWFLLRPLLGGRRDRAVAGGAPGAAVAGLLVLLVATAACWIVNPFAALFLLPALHLWLLATSTAEPLPRPVAVVLFVVGLLPVVWIVVSAMLRLSLDPLEALWYMLLLTTGHHVGLFTAVLLALWCAGAAAVISVLLGRRPAPRERSSPSGLFGPAGYSSRVP